MKKYEQIYKDLEEKIRKEIYPANTVLPGEMQLCETYQASRDTIRKALNMLMNTGYIQKQQGRGSVVIKLEQLNFPIGLTSYKELQQAQGFDSKTKMVEMYQKTITEDEEKLTGFPMGEKVWSLLRLRYIDGKVAILDRDIFLVSLVPELTKEIAEDSLYAYFENQLGLDISYAEKEITVVPLNEEDREYLDLVARDINVVSVKSHVFLGNATMFQYTESRHQVDKFHFVDFARRKKI